jgi:hypothetical protein
MMDSNVEAQISSLQHRSNEELLEIIGAYALSQEPDQLIGILALNERLDASKLYSTAQTFLEKSRPIIKDAICGKDGIATYMEKPSVHDVINILLPALGVSTLGIVPTAFIALSLIIVRSGIREYCKDL